MLELGLQKGLLRQRRASQAAIQRHGKGAHMPVTLPSILPAHVSCSLLLVLYLPLLQGLRAMAIPLSLAYL